MFAKLRISRFMKATAGNDAAVVEFATLVQHIALVHQYGLRDKPSENSHAIYYPKRALLGIQNVDKDTIQQIAMNFLSS